MNPATDLKPASELVKVAIEPGDTTQIPIPPIFNGVDPLQPLESDRTPEYNQARNAHISAHELGKQEAELHRVYKSTMDTSYIFKDGSIAIFRGRRYLTGNRTEIAELDYEILNRRNPYLYIDPAEKEADPKLEDPTERLKAKLFAEWAAQLERALNPNQDAGSTKVERINPANSASIADVAAGGGPSTGGLSPQMKMLLAKIKGSV